LRKLLIFPILEKPRNPTRMKKFVVDNSKAFSIFLAIYILLGGLTGFYLIYSLVDENTGLGSYIVIIPIAALYLVSLLGGIFYFVQSQRWRFYFLAKLVLCCQVIQLAVTGFTYYFYYGPYLALGFLEGDGLMFKFETLTCAFGVRFGNVETQGLMINAMPILLLIILRWIERAEKAPAMEVPENFLEDNNDAVTS
jgi:hypothetical protein